MALVFIVTAIVPVLVVRNDIFVTFVRACGIELDRHATALDIGLGVRRQHVARLPGAVRHPIPGLGFRREVDVAVAVVDVTVLGGGGGRGDRALVRAGGRGLPLHYL